MIIYLATNISLDYILGAWGEEYGVIPKYKDKYANIFLHINFKFNHFNLMTPPLGHNFGKNSNLETFEFWEPPLDENYELKTLKIA